MITAASALGEIRPRARAGLAEASRKAALSLFFAACLVPVQFMADVQNGLSINYLFVLLPLWLGIRRGRLVKPPTVYQLLILLYVGIFVVATLYQFDYLPFLVRRLISFGLFMTMFTFMFVRIDSVMVTAFKIAVIGVSVYLSAEVVLTYFGAGGAVLGASAKNVVGTQRTGFIYILAFWIVLQQRMGGRLWLMCKYPVLLLLVVSLLLTFSRSSVFALGASVGMFGCYRFAAWLKRPTHIFGVRQIASLAMLGVVGYVVARMVPATFVFFNETFFNLLMDRDALALHLVDPNTSEGYRVFLVQQVTEFIAQNPLTGSGFLGVWVISETLAGSAHSQLLDVLFRTGLLGFAAYVYLLGRLVKYLHGHDRSLFFGLVGILAYGIYHETFKESQGAFVLAFLLGLLSQQGKSRVGLETC